MRTKRHLTEEEIDRFYRYLDAYPGYKELIRKRIDAEQRKRRRLDSNIYGHLWRGHQTRKGLERDNLGREVEGCG